MPFAGLSGLFVCLSGGYTGDALDLWCELAGFREMNGSEGIRNGFISVV